MFIGTVVESMMGEAWVRDITTVILVVRLSSMDSVEVFGDNASFVWSSMAFNSLSFFLGQFTRNPTCSYTMSTVGNQLIFPPIYSFIVGIQYIYTDTKRKFRKLYQSIQDVKLISQKIGNLYSCSSYPNDSRQQFLPSHLP